MESSEHYMEFGISRNRWMRRKDEGVTPQPQSSQTPSRGRFGLLLVSVRNRARTAGGIPASRTAHDRAAMGSVTRIKDSDRSSTFGQLYMGEALTTASGGNFIRAEVNRNKRSPQWGAASIEIADKHSPCLCTDASASLR